MRVGDSTRNWGTPSWWQKEPSITKKLIENIKILSIREKRHPMNRIYNIFEHSLLGSVGFLGDTSEVSQKLYTSFVALDCSYLTEELNYINKNAERKEKKQKYKNQFIPALNAC